MEVVEWLTEDPELISKLDEAFNDQAIVKALQVEVYKKMYMKEN